MKYKAEHDRYVYDGKTKLSGPYSEWVDALRAAQLANTLTGNQPGEIEKEVAKEEPVAKITDGIGGTNETFNFWTALHYRTTETDERVQPTAETTEQIRVRQLAEAQARLNELTDEEDEDGWEEEDGYDLDDEYIEIEEEEEEEEEEVTLAHPLGCTCDHCQHPF